MDIKLNIIKTDLLKDFIKSVNYDIEARRIFKVPAKEGSGILEKALEDPLMTFRDSPEQTNAFFGGKSQPYGLVTLVLTCNK